MSIVKRLWVFQWINGKRGVLFAEDAEEARRLAVQRAQFNMKADLESLRRATDEEDAEIASELQKEFLR